MKKTANQIEFTEEQVKLIKSQIAPKATDDELKLFLHQAQRTGLDPLARQIYCIHRKQKDGTFKMAIQTSIDGFRLVAERTGNYGGQGEPKFEYKDGWPVKCTIAVYKFKGTTRYEAAIGVAYFSEYAQTKAEYANNQATGRKIPTEMWADKPHIMLGKVTEALALRKAFPQELSGLYTNDEMGQADNDHEARPETAIMQQPAQLPAPTSIPFQPQYHNLQAQPVAAQQQTNAAQSAATANNASPQQQPALTPFNKQYGEPAALLAVIKTAASEEDFKLLYKYNKATIDSRADMRDAITQRRAAIANHGKVIITEGQFKQVCDRLRKGDLKVYESALNTYVLNPAQKQELETIHQQVSQLEQNLTIKFEKPEDIAVMLEVCYTEQQVMKLHQNNAMIIDRTPELMTKLNARLKVLKAA